MQNMGVSKIKWRSIDQAIQTYCIVRQRLVQWNLDVLANQKKISGPIREV